MSLITIYTEKNEVDASITKGYLEAHGIIATILASAKPGYGYWVELDPQGPNRPFDILVDEKDAEEALKFLKERDNSEAF